jgi:hypothetical protein
MYYSSRPPKKSTARLAWDLYVQTFNRCPESVSYTPNYGYQIKGWICEHLINDIQIKHMNYGGSSNYVFYSSSSLIANKEHIESIEYCEPKPIDHIVEKIPSDDEINLFNELNRQLLDRIKQLYQQGVKLFDARDKALAEHGCASVDEFLKKYNCFVVAINHPRDPTSYQLRP